jgi:hypothetical protein
MLLGQESASGCPSKLLIPEAYHIDTKTSAYMWDSMDEEDRTDIMDNLDQSDKWVIWKSKDKWSVSLKDAGFNQLLHIQKDIQDEC